MGIKAEQRKVIRAVIYVRISNDRRRGSTEEGIGVKEQEEQCRELAASLGVQVVAVYSDNDVSAYSGKPRPGYGRMLGFLKMGNADVVLVWHTDRLHRDNTELEEYINLVEPRGIQTHTARTGFIDLNTPTGRMVARQLCAIARYESEHRGERVSMARLRQAKQGKYGGGKNRPYGFERDGVTVIHGEADEIRGMAKAVLSGVSLRSIAYDLRTRDIRTSTGTLWRPETVRTVLLRPRNAGFMVHRESKKRNGAYTDDDIVGKAPWKPIIKERDWRKVVAILTDPERRTSPVTGRAPRYLGSGIYACPCGATLGGKKSRKKLTREPFYGCRESGTGHVAVPIAEADDFVQRVIIERLSRKDAAKFLKGPEPKYDMTALLAELQEHRDRLDEIAADYEDDLITKAQMRKRTEMRRAKMAPIEAKLKEAEASTPGGSLLGATNVAEEWGKLTLGEQREVIKTFFTVQVMRVGSGARAKIQDRVNVRPREE